jgi:hypothetical protein
VTITEVVKTAQISDCGTYRYELTRRWGPGARVCWIMLNPSTADADVDDPTIRRCMGFTRQWGYDALTVVNLFAYRAADPRHLHDAAQAGVDPAGPLNVDCVALAAKFAGLVVAAWGANAVSLNRAAKTTQFLTACGVELWCLGKTKDGHPKHPLYVAASTPLTTYRTGLR